MFHLNLQVCKFFYYLICKTYKIYVTKTGLKTPHISIVWRGGTERRIGRWSVLTLRGNAPGVQLALLRRGRKRKKRSRAEAENQENCSSTQTAYLAEWSKAPDLRSGSENCAGSNPAVCTKVM